MSLSDLGIPGSVDLTQSCPLFGGGVGVVVNVSASASIQPLTCESGTFGSGAELALSISGANKLCTEEITFAGEVKLATSTKQCSNCNPTSCLYESDSGRTCKTAGGSGSVSLGKNWLYQTNIKRGMRGYGPVPSASINATCGASVGVAGTVSLGANGTRNQGFDCPDSACVDCANTTVGLAIGGRAGVQCNARLQVGSFKREIGCESCGEASVNVGGQVDVQSGACGSRTCGTLSGDMGATAGPISACIPLRWFHVRGEASATARIGGTYNTCTGGSWQPTADVSFEVTSGYGACE